jgi:two-component system LytT family sensor kinase
MELAHNRTTAMDESSHRRRAIFGEVSPLSLFVLWTGVGLAFGFAWYLPSSAEGNPVALKTAITWYLLDSYVWFLLCPLLFSIERRFPVSLGRSTILMGHFFLALAVAWLHFGIFICLDYLFDPAFSSRFQTVSRAIGHLAFFRTISGGVTYALIMAVLYARSFHNGLKAERERNAAIEYELAKSQLNALRMQLQPHFLFNSLHSVSALVDERPRDAIRMIAKLGMFLRATLEPTKDHMVRLDEEICFLQLYLDIEKIRLGERVAFVLDIEPLTTSTRVPSLILQPLVENALRHGPWSEIQSNSVTILSRVVDEKAVEILVRNEYESGPRKAPDAIQEGVGLSNVRSRLQQVYPGFFRFEYGWVSPDVFEVSLTMPRDPELAGASS